jgi:hypothetical protein
MMRSQRCVLWQVAAGRVATTARRCTALRRQDDVDDARVTKSETLVRRGKKWFRYDAPDKRLFKKLKNALATS